MVEMTILSSDLAGFKPNMYRLMQLSGKALELAINFTHLFHAPRNRVELISDFPDGNDAEVLSSLRLHPQGWVALSRNTSSDEGSEWCTVHDIQSLPTKPDQDVPVGERAPLSWRASTRRAPPRPRPPTEGAGPRPPMVQTFRAGRVEVVAAGAASPLDQGRPVIEIDLGVRRRAGAAGRGAEGDMVGVTVDRELGGWQMGGQRGVGEEEGEGEEEEESQEDREERLEVARMNLARMEEKRRKRKARRTERSGWRWRE